LVVGFAFLNLGNVLLSLGRTVEARTAEERARAIALATCAPRLVGAACVHLANIAYEEGLFVESEQLARDGADALVVAPPLLDAAAKFGDASERQSFLTRVPANARTLHLADAWLGSSAA